MADSDLSEPESVSSAGAATEPLPRSSSRARSSPPPGAADDNSNPTPTAAAATDAGPPPQKKARIENHEDSDSSLTEQSSSASSSGHELDDSDHDEPNVTTPRASFRPPRPQKKQAQNVPSSKAPHKRSAAHLDDPLDPNNDEEDDSGNSSASSSQRIASSSAPAVRPTAISPSLSLSDLEDHRPASSSASSSSRGAIALSQRLAPNQTSAEAIAAKLSATPEPPSVGPGGAGDEAVAPAGGRRRGGRGGKPTAPRGRGSLIKARAARAAKGKEREQEQEEDEDSDAGAGALATGGEATPLPPTDVPEATPPPLLPLPDDKNLAGAKSTKTSTASPGRGQRGRGARRGRGAKRGGGASRNQRADSPIEDLESTSPDTVQNADEVDKATPFETPAEGSLVSTEAEEPSLDAISVPIDEVLPPAVNAFVTNVLAQADAEEADDADAAAVLGGLSSLVSASEVFPAPTVLAATPLLPLLPPLPSGSIPSIHVHPSSSKRPRSDSTSSSSSSGSIIQHESDSSRLLPEGDGGMDVDDDQSSVSEKGREQVAEEDEEELEGDGDDGDEEDEGDELDLENEEHQDSDEEQQEEILGDDRMDVEDEDEASDVGKSKGKGKDIALDREEDAEEEEEESYTPAGSDHESEADDGSLRKRVEAMEALTRIEIEFARLRDKLYVERMAAIEKERVGVENGTHPELLHANQFVELRRTRKLELAKKWLEGLEDTYERRREAEEHTAWTWWSNGRAELRSNMLDEAYSKKRKLDREKRAMDRPKEAGLSPYLAPRPLPTVPLQHRRRLGFEGEPLMENDIAWALRHPDVRLDASISALDDEGAWGDLERMGLREPMRHPGLYPFEAPYGHPAPPFDPRAVAPPPFAAASYPPSFDSQPGLPHHFSTLPPMPQGVPARAPLMTTAPLPKETIGGHSRSHSARAFPTPHFGQQDHLESAWKPVDGPKRSIDDVLLGGGSKSLADSASNGVGGSSGGAGSKPRLTLDDHMATARSPKAPSPHKASSTEHGHRQREPAFMPIPQFAAHPSTGGPYAAGSAANGAAGAHFGLPIPVQRAEGRI